VASTEVSLIVRARDAERTIGRCLELLRSQDVGGGRMELIVVDSGSLDRTAAIADEMGARVVPMVASEFTFGRALNVGAAQASGELLVAVSADAYVTDRGWLARLAAHFSDPAVACASGDRWSYDGQGLEGVVRQDAELARHHPGWGYSNSAGGFRADLWRSRGFREDLPGCEDREWGLHWLDQGYVCMIDAALSVAHDHTHDPVSAIYRRARREAEGMAMFADPPVGALLREWWSPDPYYDSRLRALLSHRRAARLLGGYVGGRRAGR
jgi:rhamnosyltransferase